MARLPPAICDDCVAAVSLPFALNFVGTHYANNCNQLQRNPHLHTADPNGVTLTTTGGGWTRQGYPSLWCCLFKRRLGANLLIASWFEDL